MKVGFLLIFLPSLAFAQTCPEIMPVQCGPEEISCYAGTDANGCPNPNTCVPKNGQYKNFFHQSLMKSGFSLNF